MNDPGDSPSATDLRRLLDLVERLRAPDGCPWDREQTLADARTYLIEEAHEAAAAAAAGDWDELAGELGDLLFQVAFVARLGEEEGALDAGAVIDRILDKMIARHPHVFGGEQAADAEEVLARWEQNKLEEGTNRSLLAGVADSLPPLVAAYRISQKAAGIGFDWPGPAEVLEKLDEEIAELEAELPGLTAPGASDTEPARGASGTTAGPERPNREDHVDRMRDEIGDILFTVVNLARKLGVDPDAALAGTNAKFRRRFGQVEATLNKRPGGLAEAGLDEMERLWGEAKRSERG